MKLDGQDGGRQSPQESRRDRDVYRNGRDTGREAHDDHSRKRDDSPRRSRDEPRRESFTSTGDRPGKFSTEEKKRGQRLFGGLLSTLSQTTSNSQQKRRLEIERRQQEKAHQQKREDDKRRADKLSKLNTVRKVEQVKFDEQVMRTRHSNMRAMAHSLQTRSEPKLFYRPWELTAAQEDKIQDQIRDTEADIADEVQRFKRRKEARLKDLGVEFPPESSDMVGDPVDDRSNDAQAGTIDHRPVAQPPKIGHEKDHDEDVMVEAEEDTVIY